LINDAAIVFCSKIPCITLIDPHLSTNCDRSLRYIERIAAEIFADRNLARSLRRRRNIYNAIFNCRKYHHSQLLSFRLSTSKRCALNFETRQIGRRPFLSLIPLFR
jgi:hypothetical protein